MSGGRLFLHFLDREVSFLSHSILRPSDDFLAAFKICALHSCEQMVLSGGHLFEHPAAQIIFRRFFELFQNGQIVPIAKARSVEDFVREKSLQYEHARDSSRRDYSIYFGGRWEEILNGPIYFEAPTVDTTEALAAAMRSDFSNNEDYAKRVVDAIESRNNRAITAELFEENRRWLSDQVIADVHFSVSRNYQKIYRNQYAKMIFVETRLVNPHLEVQLGSELSFGFARYLYENLNLRRVFRNPRFSLGQFRGSIEHVRYVDAIRSIGAADTSIDLRKLGRVLRRTVPSVYLGGRVISEVDTQLHAVSAAIEQFGGASLDDVFHEVDREYHEAWALSANPDFQESEAMSKDQVNYANPKRFLVIATQKELRFAREFLRGNGFDLSSETNIADNKIGQIFAIRSQISGSEVEIPVALVRANQKGKSEMRALLEAIDRFEDPSVVIMIGMMAGIKGKSKIFDVVAPRPIYDATTISTQENRIYVEPVPTYMDPALHNRISNVEWSETPESGFRIITDKVTVTVPGTFDSMSHELAKQAVIQDPENTVGLEMEASALSEMQRDQTQTGRSVRYLMIKGVADYAGEQVTGSEVEELRRIDSIAAILPKGKVESFDPRGNDGAKTAFQREATYRSIAVALRLLSKFPNL